MNTNPSFSNKYVGFPPNYNKKYGDYIWEYINARKTGKLFLATTANVQID